MNIDRQTLYEQVWTTPMSRLSRTYGMSDVGLAKICKQHGIPRPPRGYWGAERRLQKLDPIRPILAEIQPPEVGASTSKGSRPDGS